MSLDNFRHILQNKGIRSRLDAWLAFLSLDEPEWIEAVIETCPEFRSLYEEVYEMCRNLEKVMEMYSKELQELDRNTVQYMIDEMQETINQKNEQLNQKDEQLIRKDEQLSQKDEQLNQKDAQLAQLEKRIEEQTRQLQELRSRMEQANP